MKKPDCIISLSTPISSHIVGMYLKAFWKVRWYAFFSDPLVDKNMLIPPYAKRPKHRKQIIAKADGLIFPCPATANAELKYEDKNYFRKVHIIPHMIGTTKLSENGLNIPSIKKNKAKNFLEICHFGRFYPPSRTPENIIKAVKSLGLPIKLRFYGTNKMDIDTETEKIVEWIKEPVNYAKSIALQKQSDILLIIDMDSLETSHFYPSKITDYLYANRPILALAIEKSFTAKIVREANGWVVSPSDINDIKNTLQDLYRVYKNNALEEYSPPRELLEKYSSQKTAKKYLTIFQKG